MTASDLQARLRELYCGSTRRAQAFRYGLIIFDLVTVTFVIVTSFVPANPAIEIADMAFGVLILADLAARLVVERRRLRFLASPVTLADLAASISFLLPIAGEGLGFLRVVRTIRLLHTYELMGRLKTDHAFFREHEHVFLATVNLLVFLFVMTGLIYATQYRTNPDIGNYADALYFTVTALTTTGFGDITLPGVGGRMLSVAIMIFGVTLFLRLAQVLFRPPKVRFTCPECGLNRHDPDAVHCKHCGETLHIETEGAV